MDFIKTNLIYFWKIGKLVYEKRKVYDNIIERSSKYFSYYFGNSTLFTRDNIKFNDVSPITVFRFLKAMRESHKVLDGDDMFNIDDFKKEDDIAFGDKTIFEI